MNRRFAALLGSVALAALTLRPASAADTKSAPWWKDEWRYRKIVLVSFPDAGNDLPVSFFETSDLLGERPVTGKALITTDEDPTASARDIVVTDANGEVLPARAYASGWDRSITVLFRAEPKTAEYYVYYGNPRAQIAPKTWKTNPYPILMLTVPVADPRAIESPARAARALLAAKQERGRIGTYSVNNSANPFGLEAGQAYLTLYSGLLLAPVTGTYEFAVDAGGTAHFLLDRSLVLTVRGGARPAANWRQKALVKLTRGIHNFTILHGESREGQGISVAWRPPTERRLALITGAAFALGSYAPAEIVGLEERGKPATPFFAAEPSEFAFEVGAKALVPVDLTDLTRGDGLSSKWTVDGTSLQGRTARCFVPADNPCKVALEVFQEGKSLGTCTRTLSFRAVRHVRPDLSFELIQSPNVIYEGEGAKLTFKVSNLSECALPVRYDVAAGKADPVSTDVEVAPGSEEPLDIDLPAPPATESSTVATVRLWLVGVKQAEQVIRIIRPGPHLAALQPRLGRLFDQDGRQVVVLTHLEDANEHRRWAPVKWLARQMKPSPKTILLFGDAMQNTSDETGGAGAYADILARRLTAAGRSFTFVRATDDPIAPCVADIPAFADALAKHTPDLVIISPGSRDALRGVSRRQFARSLDVCVDLARSQPKPPDIVLVSPPPLVSNVKASEELAAAVRTIAEQHQARFVNLHALLTDAKNWKTLYRQEAEDEVYYLYPNPETHENFAEAIIKAIP